MPNMLRNSAVHLAKIDCCVKTLHKAPTLTLFPKPCWQLESSTWMKLAYFSIERPHPQSAGTTKWQRWVGTRNRQKKKPELAIVR